MSFRVHARRWLLGVAVVLLGGVPVQAQAKKPANILIILCDDVGYGEFGFQGSKDVPTPHIDSIAKNGVRFTQGYVSGPYCSPTRAGLLTGRYQTRYGHEFNGQGPKFGLPLSERTIADLLKGLGYATCCVGKWHLGFESQFRPTNRGFDEFFGTLANTPFYHPKNFVDSRINNDVREIADAKFYTTEEYGKRAVDWLDKNSKRPWFLYLPFNAQHAPLQAPDKYLDRFAGIKDEKRRTFAAMMSAMDDAVGRVLAKVRALGQEEETLIVFLSDNGGPTPQTSSSNGVLRGFKATTLEGGVRVPFCMQWKGKLPAGKVYEHPIIQLDLLPTCVAAAGGKIDPAWKLDGVDLMPYVTGANKGRPHDTFYWRFGEQWAVRKGDWKLVVSRIDGPEPRLFNLAQDVGEAKDLIATEPARAKELRALYDAWNAEQAKPLWQPGEKKKAKKKKTTEEASAPAFIHQPVETPRLDRRLRLSDTVATSVSLSRKR
jgi:arylsulfatase A-like enzyme